MSDTNDPRNPDFDLRTAKPDPRRIASKIIPRTDNQDLDMVSIRGVIQTLVDTLKARYPDETMNMIATVFELEEGRRVMVEYGFASNQLPEED